MYKYKVANIRITDPNDSILTMPTDNEKLTMNNCYPFNYVGRAPDRFIVECEYVGVFDKE